MAGAGYKLFNTGDVLSASDVNTYLMQQTVMSFASSAARTTALASVLAEGMVTYLQDTNVVEIYTGSSWVSLDDPNAIQNSIVDAKGDLIAASANDTPARLAVGANTAVLTADSTASTGLAWEGVWQDWTASITGITVGNGTVISRYRKVGKSVDVYFKFTMGSTSAISGLNYFALPFAQKTTSEGGFISGGITDFGVTTYSPFSETNGNNIILGVVNSSGAYGTWVRISSTVPMTWATNDIWWAYIRYEAA